MSILRYFSKRLTIYVITVFGAITVNFFIPRLIPGDPITTMIRNMERQGVRLKEAQQIIETYKSQFGLKGDYFTQYVSYLNRLFHGDLGPSIMAFPVTVQELIVQAIPWTIGLLTATTLIAWTLGNLLGAFIGWKKDSKFNVALTGLCLFLNQIPYYILAMVLLFLFAYTISIFPTSRAYGMGITPSLDLRFMVDVLYHAALPALSIVCVEIGGWMIGMRQMMINVLGEDYLLFAEAKGLRKNRILMKYAFRNALLPQVTGLAMAIGAIMSGAMLTEVIFTYPGIGWLYNAALQRLDYNTMQGIFLLVTLSTLTAMLLIDLLYPIVDPRISYGQ